MKKHTHFALEKGIGLLELMLSLAIIALLVVLATRYYGVASRSQKVNEALTEVLALKTAAINWKAGNSDFTGISAVTIQNAGLMPSEYTGSTTAPGNFLLPWTNAVMTVTASSGNANIGITGLTSSDCNLLARKLNVSDANCGTGALTYTVTG